MPTIKLTALAIPKLSPNEYYDALVPGLVLRVGRNRRTWYCRFRAGGTYKRKRLGHFPALELGEARDKSRLVIERADQGIPIEVPPPPHPRSADAMTLGKLLDRYQALRKREGKKIKTLDEAMQLLRRSLAPYLSLPADQFSKADLRAARDVMTEADAMIGKRCSAVTFLMMS